MTSQPGGGREVGASQLRTRSDFFHDRAQTGHKTGRGELISIRRKHVIARGVIITLGAEYPDYRLQRCATRNAQRVTRNINPRGKSNYSIDVADWCGVGIRTSTCCSWCGMLSFGFTVRKVPILRIRCHMDSHGALRNPIDQS